MKQRQLVIIALALAVVVQTAFVAVYYTATSGCFCAITTGRPSPGPFAAWTFEIGSSPLRQTLDAIRWEVPFQIGGAAAASIFAVINAIPWTAGLFLLFNGIALPFRIRRGSAHGEGRGFTIGELHGVRPWWMGGATALLVFAGLTGGAWARRQWIMSAEHAVASAVRSIRQGQPFHERAGIEVACYDDCSAERFAGSYVFLRDEASLGTHLLDLCVAPVVMTGHLRTIDGARFRVNVYHIDGVWSVLMGQAPT
jgi:hypothetical protein